MDIQSPLIPIAATLAAACDSLTFEPPVSHVYNPLQYAWAAHHEYLRRYTPRRTRAVFLGMNPGPWGMAQTGVPFGEVAAVRDWLGISAAVGSPQRPHPKRPIEGWECAKSEVSGRRLWGAIRARFGSPAAFFADQIVLNYCPLVFMAAGGRNITPDKLPVAERTALFAACDAALAAALGALAPRFVVGIGAFAAQKARTAVTAAWPTPEFQTGPAQPVPQVDTPPATVVQILHPSPASPAANRGWAEAAERALVAGGVW